MANQLPTRYLNDVSLVVGRENKRYGTQKALLSNFSEVFQSVFYGPMAEEGNEIPLPEDSAEAVEVFLKYVNTETVSLNNVDEALSCMYFADKYMVKYMKTECITYLGNHISLENVLNIYEEAVTLQISELKNKCWEFVRGNISEIIISPALNSVKYETMKDIASEKNWINARPPEILKYNAIVKWGRTKFHEDSPENLRRRIDPLIREINFTSMSYSEFSGAPCTDGLLTREEQLQMFKSMATRSDTRNELRIGSQTLPGKLCVLSSHCTGNFDECVSFQMVKDKFKSKLPYLHVQGVYFKMQVKSKGSYPLILQLTMNRNADLRMFFDFSVRNVSRNTLETNDVRTSFRVYDRSHSTVMKRIYFGLKKPLLLLEGDVCEIVVNTTTNNSFWFVYCKSSCPLSNYLERVEPKFDGPHFDAVEVYCPVKNNQRI